MSIKTYTELSKINSFIERYYYLRIGGRVGEETFGFDRYLNQNFYTSKEWRTSRRIVIARDEGYDLGYRDELYEIPNGVSIVVHHINPITIDDIVMKRDIALDPENLISTIDRTHKAIHYGDESLLITPFIERTANDTCPWKI